MGDGWKMGVQRQGKESSENFLVFTELFLHAKATT